MGKRNEGSETGIGWRLLWGVVGAGLTATVLTVSGLGLTVPVVAGASVAMGLIVAWGGPMLLDLLNLV
jgi:hypothetical protein